MQAELELFRPLVVGQEPHNIEAILIALDRALRGAPQAKAAIDCALHELKARALGVPLNALFGGQVRDQVPILRILAIKTPSEMAAAAQKLVDKGYRYLKIKVHGEVEEDVARVAAIRKQVGDDVHLTIDANQSYTPKDAIAALNRMAEYRIDLCEQPVDADDFEGLALVTRTVPVTVEADEAAGSLREVFELVSRRAVDAVSLKIPKLGGLRNTLAAARLCEAAHIQYRLGAAVGSRAALRAGAAFCLRDAGHRLCLRAWRVRPPARRSVRGARGCERRAHAAAGSGSGVRLIAQKNERMAKTA